MKISEFMKEVYEFTVKAADFKFERTCDTLKAGHPEYELVKVATAMMATPEVIRTAAEWGANLLIVHEPVFYDHWDDLSALDQMPEWKQRLIRAKLSLIEQSGVTIYRYHDHPHLAVPDLISQGEIKFWGLKGTWKQGANYAVNEFELEAAVPVAKLMEIVKQHLRLSHLRLCGSPDTICRKIGLCFGTPGHIEEELMKNDVVMTGELCEWQQGEFIRDYIALMEEKKAVLVMGHIGSERDGMRLLAEILQKRYPQFEARYFECGETYLSR